MRTIRLGAAMRELHEAHPDQPPRHSELMGWVRRYPELRQELADHVATWTIAYHCARLWAIGR